MEDYLYSDIKGVTVHEILSNPLLDFIAPISLTTGEINPLNHERKKTLYNPKDQKKANFKGLNITVTNNRYINLQGSLHEFFHGNNSGDFTRAEVELAINEIASALNVDPGLVVLHNLEFGVNVILHFPVRTFLDSILCYKGQRPDRTTYNNGCQIKFKFEQYEIKLYDKGNQLGLESHVLRVEIKVRKMQFLHAKGLHIKTLNDLINKNYYPERKEILTNAINSIVLCERDSNKREMSLNEKRIFTECSDPNYWFALWKDHQSKYRKKFPRFRKINDEYGKLKIHSTIVELVSTKWDQLTQKTGTDITGVNGKSSSDITNRNFQQIETTGTDITLQVIGNIQPSIIESRKCKSCGRDISNQKPGSLFCSEKKYGAEGKKCRNRDSNPRNNFYYREDKKKRRGLLFDTYPLLIVPELKELCKLQIENRNEIQKRK